MSRARARGNLQDLVDLGDIGGAEHAAPEPTVTPDEPIPPTIRMVRSDDFYDQVARALPEGINAKRFIRVCETAVLARPNFLFVPPHLLEAELLRCAALGLEPNSPLGHYFLAPELLASGAWSVSAIMGYKGMLQLIHRTPSIEFVRVAAIRENDEYDYDQGTEAYIVHKQALTDRGDPLVYYVIWKRAGVPRADFELVTLDEIQERKQFSVMAEAEGSAWNVHEDLMNRKTALRIAFTFMPVDSNVASAVAGLDQPQPEPAEPEPHPEPESGPEPRVAE